MAQHDRVARCSRWVEQVRMLHQCFQSAPWRCIRHALVLCALGAWRSFYRGGRPGVKGAAHRARPTAGTPAAHGIEVWWHVEAARPTAWLPDAPDLSLPPCCDGLGSCCGAWGRVPVGLPRRCACRCRRRSRPGKLVPLSSIHAAPRQRTYTWPCITAPMRGVRRCWHRPLCMWA